MDNKNNNKNSINNNEIAPFDPTIPPPEIPAKIIKREGTPIKIIEKSPEFKKPAKQASEIFKKPALPKPALWKLFRGKFLLTFYLCTSCRDQLFKSQDKVKMNNDRVEMKIEICMNCVKKNCMVTDLIAPYNKK